MLLWTLLIIALVYLDQMSKYLAVIFLKGEESFPLWQDVLHLTYVENRGAAFGMLKDHRWVFMVISTVAIIGILVYLSFHHKDGRLQSLSLSMLIAGGIGNMIDRIVLGYVIDFIDFTLIDFAVFNIADSCVCVGVGLLMLCLIIDTVRSYKEEKRAKLANTAEDVEPTDVSDDASDKENGK